MLRKLFLLLLMPSLLFAAEIIKSYSFSVPAVQDGKIIMNNTYIAATACAPSVAVHAVQLMIPRGQTVVSYTVEYGNPILLNGTHFLQPSIPPTPKSHAPIPRVKALSKVYAENVFFPSQIQGSSDFTVQYTGGIPIFYTTIFPTQYNASSQQVRYYDKITVKVITAPASDEPPYFCTPALKSSLKTLVENPEEVDNLPVSAAKSSRAAAQFAVAVT